MYDGFQGGIPLTLGEEPCRGTCVTGGRTASWLWGRMGRLAEGSTCGQLLRDRAGKKCGGPKGGPREGQRVLRALGPEGPAGKTQVAGAGPQHARGSAGTTDPPLRQRSVILRPREAGSRRAERCRGRFRPDLSSSLSQRCLLLRTTPVPPQAPPARPHLKSMPPNTTKAAVSLSTCEFGGANCPPAASGRSEQSNAGESGRGWSGLPPMSGRACRPAPGAGLS